MKLGLLNSNSSDPEILTLACIHQDGSKILQVINLKKEPVTLEVQGYDSEKISQFSTTETNNWEEIKNGYKTKKGKVVVELKPLSVNSVVFLQKDRVAN